MIVIDHNKNVIITTKDDWGLVENAHSNYIGYVDKLPASHVEFTINGGITYNGVARWFPVSTIRYFKTALKVSDDKIRWWT